MKYKDRLGQVWSIEKDYDCTYSVMMNGSLKLSKGLTSKKLAMESMNKLASGELEEVK